MDRIIGIADKAGGAADDTVRLDHDHRSRRRIVLTTLAGRSILLDEQRPVHLRDGTLLSLASGATVRVEAEPEAVLEIAASSSADLVRIAWHLGNRHLPTQLLPGDNGGTIRIRADHVIAAMVEGLGGTASPLNAPFDPEGGAYAGGTAAPAHAHGHSHGHSHAHGSHDHHHEPADG